MVKWTWQCISGTPQRRCTTTGRSLRQETGRRLLEVSRVEANAQVAIYMLPGSVRMGCLVTPLGKSCMYVQFLDTFRSTGSPPLYFAPLSGSVLLPCHATEALVGASYPLPSHSHPGTRKQVADPPTLQPPEAEQNPKRWPSLPLYISGKSSSLQKEKQRHLSPFCP